MLPIGFCVQSRTVLVLPMRSVYLKCEAHGLEEVKNPSEFMLNGKPRRHFRIDRSMFYGRNTADPGRNPGTRMPE